MFHLQYSTKHICVAEKSRPKFCFVKLYFASTVPQKGTIYHQIEKYRILGSLLDTNYLQKLVISLDNMWLSLSGKIKSQTTYVSIRKIPMHLVKFSLHSLIGQRLCAKSHGPCFSRKQSSTFTLT